MAKDCYERLYINTLERLKSSTEDQEKEKDNEKEKEHENENNKELETDQNKEKEREQMQQLMSQFTIDDIALNENKYRGLLTITEFLGGPNSILYEATFQSLDFAKTLLKAINEAANVFKLQVCVYCFNYL
ncbi:SAP DNA-binding domain-containing protein [Reticulomyxa filosa]|uniref:SAP DNA-binding domain-containing protein n=1 Tax=Reticulomyxa filosa TaxID=46433 RepID=X6NNI3_RETFI|nr:SAP DNA-binding domain-containing protein [Reticulomyxa filosa]|eukprot:ETO26922.1 SAP DNA-binding domain-containing protein [Reticulomyxa filosa]